ncbi:hypothetical protein BCR35DRAFT_142696 [Leucosporidium creatinivorum]|uniref:PX domain-containing protein n=1 Tax=Leucosporidium creatinivorum TaxID=106004 RepID=A0A1Y2ERU4_9BASI|nr:hypothetical protein BCR35DRAFT_142696 [Leucosporidium creatinivorum]
MTAPAPLSLLPAFEPLPAVSFSDSPTQTSPVSPVFAAAPAPSTPPTVTPTPVSVKHGSGSSNFFTRARSASLHNSSPVASFFRRDEEAPPPVPSTPQTTSSGRDFTFPSTSSAPISPIDDALYPPIKSVSVPHHSKAGKNWVYACRVVPEPLARPTLAQEASSVSVEMARRESLGRMELAGKGVDGAREPHTVWRTWTEFVEFSARLSNAFPVVNPPSPTSDGSPSALPSSFYRQVPRLAKKVTLFVTRATLVQRQTDLDLFVRRLFDMPDQVKRSPIVRDFFRMREEDLTGMASSASLLSPPSGAWGEVAQDGPESFSSFLAAASSPNETVRPPMPNKRRPGLAVKISTPNLRGTALAHDFEGAEPVRPAAPRANTENVVSHLRTSNYSVSTSSSTSSSITVTPQSVSNSTSHSSFKKPSPLGSTFRFGGSPDVEYKPAAAPAEPKKRPSLGPLRHFRSLQDLRHQSSAPAYPSEPMPKLASVGMLRAVTQPHPLPSPSPASSPALSSSPFPFPQSSASSTYSASPAMSRGRSGSKSSSTSSFEDLWGGPAYMSPNPSSQSATFRHGPSGRLDRVPESAQRPRRPSMPGSRHTAGSIGTKASCGHSSTPSTSSIGSARSSNAGSSLDLTRSLGDYRSRRSSTDYSFSEAGSLSTPRLRIASLERVASTSSRTGNYRRTTRCRRHPSSPFLLPSLRLATATRRATAANPRSTISVLAPPPPPRLAVFPLNSHLSTPSSLPPSTLPTPPQPAPPLPLNRLKIDPTLPSNFSTTPPTSSSAFNEPA